MSFRYKGFELLPQAHQQRGKLRRSDETRRLSAPLSPSLPSSTSPSLRIIEKTSATCSSASEIYRTLHQSHSPIPATRNARRVDSSKPFTLSLSPLFKPTPLTSDIQHIHILSSFLPEEFPSSPITLKLRPILTRQLPSLGFVGSVSLPSSAHHPRTSTNHLV